MLGKTHSFIFISIISVVALFIIIIIVATWDKHNTPPPIQPITSNNITNSFQDENNVKSNNNNNYDGVTPTPNLLKALPEQKTLQNDYQVYQTYNNCGPASLSMALSYYGINVSQNTLGQELRPFQNPQGNNDDKSVFITELSQKAMDYNLLAYHRPNGNVELLKQFINNDIPVITQTILTQSDDIGHYRIIKGYNDKTQQLIQDDSYQGPNLTYSYKDFNEIWAPYNHEYLIVAPKDKKQIIEQILGENIDATKAWQASADATKKRMDSNPEDINSGFSYVVSLYYLGRYQDAVSVYEKIKDKFPPRALWYQIEPIKAYYEIGQYKKVFEITDSILNNGNKAFSELYVIRGNSYLKQNNYEGAKAEFRKAILYNSNSKDAQLALKSVK
jgi:tetratricopeptide (TPR) repeat protein